MPCRSTNGWPVKIDAMPLIMVNRVLILSVSLPDYQRRAPLIAKLFELEAGEAVMGTSLGDKIVIVIALLLLVVGGVMIVEFPGIIRAARLVATL